jgi:hypothetical protein
MSNIVFAFLFGYIAGAFVVAGVIMAIDMVGRNKRG